MNQKLLRFFLGFTLAAGPLYAAEKPIYLDEDQPLEARVEDALSRLTLEEKVALCHAQSKFSSKGVARLGIPELWMSDGPHGVRYEIQWDSWGSAQWTNDSCTAFPALTALAATFNPETSYLYGETVGAEARYRNKDVLLGPGVNIYRTPLNGRNFEYMGEDPYLASVMAVPYVKGVQSNGVAACVKHYALNNQEVFRMFVDVEVSERALREIYLPAFKATAEESWSFMGAYNKYLGEHCCHNHRLLVEILKEEWGYDGAVISDWGGTHDTHQSAYNGLDIEMGTGTNGLTQTTDNHYDSYYLALPFLEKLRSGEIPEEIVNDKARRVLRLIFRTAMDSRRPWGSFASEENAAVSRRIAEESIVLLKNDKRRLPLKTGSIRTIAVIGENATRSMTIAGGSSELKVKEEVSPLEGIRKRFGHDVEIIHAMGYGSGRSSYGKVIPSPYDADSLKNEAIEAARAADLVIFVGGLNKSHEQDCEAGDRTILGLPFGQEELIDEIHRVNPNLVVVLVSGNAVAMPWLEKASAVLQAWYLGSEAGNAIAAVLAGDVNPSGKLPFTFPVRLEDNGAHSFGTISYPGIDGRQVYKEDILVGYRWHDTKHIAPLFPFGYGLSYTTFEYGVPSTDRKKYPADGTIKITFEMRNTGTLYGADVAQVYVGHTSSNVPRAAKELKAFRKEFLEPGKSKKITLDIPVGDLAYYDEGKKEWVVEPGEYLIYLGNSSRDIYHHASVTIE